MTDSARLPVDEIIPDPAFNRFDLPGLNLPLNFTPHEARKDFNWKDDGNHEITLVPGQGEGRNLFRTALNNEDREGGYAS